MVEVKIPFKDAFKDVMLSGAKTWTSRTKKYGKPGDVFKVFGQYFEIVRVEHMALAIAANHYAEEGCSSRLEFIDVWEHIHPRKGYRPTQGVYVHIFKRSVNRA